MKKEKEKGAKKKNRTAVCLAEQKKVYAVNEWEEESSGIIAHNETEDKVLKASAQFFADVLLPYFGIKGKVVAAAPTELIHLDMRKMLQDYTFVMEDGSWIHFEFQSTDGGRKDLKRFRMYESTAGYVYNVEITTYVLFSGKVKRWYMRWQISFWTKWI